MSTSMEQLAVAKDVPVTDEGGRKQVQDDVGGAQTSEVGTGRSAQCTGWQRAGEQVPLWLT